MGEVAPDTDWVVPPSLDVHVYVLLFVSDVTVMGEVAPDADSVAPPSLEVQVAVKPVIALPPLPLAVNATTAELLPRVTPDNVGASGAVPTTNEVEAADAGPAPASLVAITLQV